MKTVSRFLTNFPPHQLPVYEAACEEYKRRYPNGGLFVVDGPNLDRDDGFGEEFYPDPNDKGLYAVDVPNGDTSNFHRIRERLEKKHERK